MAIFNVTNATELQTALGKAAGGDRIILASGSYGSVSINNRSYASAVTLESASSSNPTQLDGLKIANSKNISVIGLDLGRALVSGEPDYTQLNWIRDSINIKFDEVSIHGSLDGNPLNDGVGLALTNVTSFKINNSSFTELWRGLVVQKSANVSVQDNDFTLIRSDGAVVAGSDGLVFDGNSFKDFRPSAALGDHADAIQFFNTGQSKGSSNITIKNNVVMPGYHSGISGSGVQGLFISDPMTYGYKNILIQNNLIYSNGAYHGINVNGGTDVQIIGNTVVSKADDDMRVWIRTGDSSNVVIRDNVSDDVLLQNSTSVFLSDNINFAVTPGARAQIPNLSTPQSPLDLMLSNAGYKGAPAAFSAPVSEAVGSFFGSILSQNNSTSHSMLLAEDDSSKSIDLSGLKSAIVGVETAGHAPELALAPHAWTSVPAPANLFHFDHFAALP